MATTEPETNFTATYQLQTTVGSNVFNITRTTTHTHKPGDTIITGPVSEAHT